MKRDKDDKKNDKKEKVESRGLYQKHTGPLQFFSSGCTLLDCVIGGGYPLGRIANAVGDKSTGKTLLAIEGSANFARTFSQGKIRYREVESAFDDAYAGRLGMPMDRVERSPGGVVQTVEQVFDDMRDFMRSLGKDEGYYILDSLDAVSDAAELDAEFGAASFGVQKAKDMSKMFRLLIRDIEHAKLHVLIISQLRDKIGVMFGEKQTRAGGRALDFYSSQVFWLHDRGKIRVTKDGIERSIGIDVFAKCKKNKVAIPDRDCKFPIIYQYGIDDVRAAVEWMEEAGRLKVLKLDGGGTKDKDAAAVKKYLNWFNKASQEDFVAERAELMKLTKQEWFEVEKLFAPTRSKY